ncbi:trypsin-like peptidase domain-containing protein [Mesorhizobium sp. CAU 1732]|uniref:trypsin-like peptidase domain-containing protein n=1 Tax=Mesorhizobium sp. CAU 1732 TaxID=3140358 RepID=UPI003260E9D1
MGTRISVFFVLVCISLLAPASFASAQVVTDENFFATLPASELVDIEAAAKAGSVDATYLQSLYLISSGQGGEERAAFMRERAAAAGHPAAQSALCLLQSLADDEPSTRYCFEGAVNGDATSQSWLALGLTLGMFGLEENQNLALSFYRQAAFQGHVSSLARIGDAYATGEGVSQDDALAIYYWERAASMDDPSSLRELGRWHAIGRGVEQDLEKALRYLNRAADLGDGSAQYYAGLIHRLNGHNTNAHVMFSLAVKSLSPGDMRDVAIKARTEEERILTSAQIQRSRSILSTWKQTDRNPQPFIAGVEFTKRLQTALNERGYSVGEVDGLAGSKTRAAYREFVSTLQMGELSFSSPAIYFVAYKLALFGKESGSASVHDAPKTSDPINRGASVIGAGHQSVRSGGSGFIVNQNGYIVTNAHVVEGCTGIRVVHGLGEPVAASVLDVSEFSDLAILKAPLAAPTAISFRAGTPLQLGENVVVFGFPLTGVLSSQGNLTVGNLTALSGMRGDPSTLQISAPVQPGNSGGPVLDSRGQLIGVVVSKLDTLAVAGVIDDIPQNVNFAIRSSVLENLLQSRSVDYERAGSNLPELPVTKLAEIAKTATVTIQCLAP